LSKYIESELSLVKNSVLEGRGETIPFVITLKGVYSSTPSIAILLVIDTSLSMDGAKIFRAKQAALNIINQLREVDYVAVYSFNARFQKVLDLTPVSQRKVIEDAIISLKLGSGTDIYGTINGLINEITSRNLTANFPVRIIFITDGKPETGRKNPDDIIEASSKLGKLGVTGLVIGVGSDYNEKILMGIAKKLKGVYEHVDNPDKLMSVINEYVRVSKEISAKNVKINFNVNPGVKILIYNREYEVKGQTYIVDVGDVNYGETINIVGDIEIPPLTRGVFEIGTYSISYVKPEANAIEFTPNNLIKINVVSPSEFKGIEISEKTLVKSQIIKKAIELEQELDRGRLKDVESKLSEIAEITLKIGDEELTAKTMSIRDKIDRSGLTPDISKEIASILSRIRSGRLKEKEGEGK